MKKDLRITEFLLQHADNRPVSFHTPGHKGSHIYRRFGYGEFLARIMDCDLTEISGSDNLFQPDGIIKAVQDKYSDLYGVSHSYLLINGTSGGIIASILATVPAGSQLIMARNSHKSVFNALTLADAQPVYAYPELIEEHGISGEITHSEIERCLTENPRASAVIVTSPNYYGVCSDVSAIAETVHRHDKILIIDQAHGAHLKFFEKHMPKAAEAAGADIVINSIHKTLTSFTQSAVLNLTSERVDRYLLEDKLQCIQSTSPSYLLMASLDINASILESHGHTLMKEWADNLDYFYREQPRQPGLKLLTHINNFDRSKINIDTTGLNVTAAWLEEELIKQGIYPEFTTGNILMLMTGIGNRREDYEKLLYALNKINHGDRHFGGKTSREDTSLMKLPPLQRQVQLFDIPKSRMRIPLEEAESLICASPISPYPPGIPLVCPGEKIDAEIIAYIKALRDGGQDVIGINEKGEITVGQPFL